MIVGYIIAGLIDYRFDIRRKHYRRQAAFRFALGIALFLWDLLGTKLQVLTQPFFPGPAGIMEAFVSEGNFIFQNTLYSLRLYIFGFFFGVLLHRRYASPGRSDQKSPNEEYEELGHAFSDGLMPNASLLKDTKGKLLGKPDP